MTQRKRIAIDELRPGKLRITLDRFDNIYMWQPVKTWDMGSELVPLIKLLKEVLVEKGFSPKPEATRSKTKAKPNKEEVK